MSDTIHVTACSKCNGWHPNSIKCPPRRRVNIGLTDCKRCNGWHRTENVKLCSMGWTA